LQPILTSKHTGLNDARSSGPFRGPSTPAPIPCPCSCHRPQRGAEAGVEYLKAARRIKPAEFRLGTVLAVLPDVDLRHRLTRNWLDGVDTQLALELAHVIRTETFRAYVDDIVGLESAVWRFVAGLVAE
jgi:hypothetical protein